MGLRTSFNAVENASPNRQEYSNDFNIDNARIYVNGKLHKWIGFEFNTECFGCSGMRSTIPGNYNNGGSGIGLLDAIGKFELHESFNIWVGRMLLPSERGMLNNAFYQATYDGNRTPAFPADQGGNGNSGAGTFGRDNAATIWGKFHPMGTHLLYAVSVSQGLRGNTTPNIGSSLMYTGRLQWNLLNDEKNPGYYTSGTYYGAMGDILAIAGSVQHQAQGAGSATTGLSDFTGLSADVLFEKVLPNNMGVFTFNGEFKRFFANYGENTAALNVNCFCIFNGHAWTVTALYLIPQEIGIGRFQPYVRFTSIDPRDSYGNDRNEWEPGINYVISGHNARVSAFYRYGDLMSYGAPQGGNYPTTD